MTNKEILLTKKFCKQTHTFANQLRFSRHIF